MRWDEFARWCPEIARLGEARLRTRELCLVGTLRRDGSPRISPVEPDFVDGELMLGMMWQSPKARDLIRDARCVVHSTVSDRNGTEGDFKLYGRALPVDDPERRARYCATIRARIDWEPTEPEFHCSPSTSGRRASSSSATPATVSPGPPARVSDAGRHEAVPSNPLTARMPSGKVLSNLETLGRTATTRPRLEGGCAETGPPRPPNLPALPAGSRGL